MVSLFYRFTYATSSIDNWIIATVAHCQPMTTKENYINVFVPRTKIGKVKHIMVFQIKGQYFC